MIGLAVGYSAADQGTAVAHQVRSGRYGAAGRPLARVSNRYTSPDARSALRCSSVKSSVAVVT